MLKNINKKWFVKRCTKLKRKFVDEIQNFCSLFIVVHLLHLVHDLSFQPSRMQKIAKPRRNRRKCKTLDRATIYAKYNMNLNVAVRSDFVEMRATYQTVQA